MVDFEYYASTYGGKLTEEQFNFLMLDSYQTLILFAEKCIPYWRIEEDLLMNGLEPVVCKQIDFLYKVGGVDSLIDGGVTSLKKVETSGFTYEYDRDQIKDSMLVDGIPVSSMVQSLCKTTWRKQGLMYRGVL